MYLKDDDLVIRDAAVEDVQILSDWWAHGRVMAHAGFPKGVYTDAAKLMDKIRNQSDAERRLIIEVPSNRVGEMVYRTKDDISEIGIKICDLSYQERGYGGDNNEPKD